MPQRCFDTATWTQKILHGGYGIQMPQKYPILRYPIVRISDAHIDWPPVICIRRIRYKKCDRSSRYWRTAWMHQLRSSRSWKNRRSNLELSVIWSIIQFDPSNRCRLCSSFRKFQPGRSSPGLSLISTSLTKGTTFSNLTPFSMRNNLTNSSCAFLTWMAMNDQKLVRLQWKCLNVILSESSDQMT